MCQLTMGFGSRLQKIAICERGFSKQDFVKSHLQASLKLDTLDALMQISLCKIELENLYWPSLPS